MLILRRTHLEDDTAEHDMPTLCRARLVHGFMATWYERTNIIRILARVHSCGRHRAAESLHNECDKILSTIRLACLPAELIHQRLTQEQKIIVSEGRLLTHV